MYILQRYLTILPKVTPLMSVCCLVFKPRDYVGGRGGLPCAVSVEHVAFLMLLPALCIMG